VDTIKLNPRGDCLPVRIEVDNEDDYIFIADQKGNRILRYSKDGAYQGEIVGEKERFAKPSGIAPDKAHRRFYVADTGKNRVQKFFWR
jgi:DNA-binding beta-propeller fold protein YncE